MAEYKSERTGVTTAEVKGHSNSKYPSLTERESKHNSENPELTEKADTWPQQLPNYGNYVSTVRC